MIVLVLSLLYLGGVLVFAWWVFFRQIPETRKLINEIEARTRATKARTEAIRQQSKECKT